VFGVLRTTLAPCTSTHARARGGGRRRTAARWGAPGSRCEGETPSRRRPCQHGARGQKKDDGFFRGRAGGADGICKRRGRAGVRTRRRAPSARSRVARTPRPVSRRCLSLLRAPRAAGGAAQRCASTRAHSPAPALRTTTQPTRSAGARARRRRSDGRGFFRRCAPQVLLLSLSYGGSKCTRLRLGAPVPTQSEATGASAAHFETPPHHVPDRTRPLHARARICV